MDKVRIGTISAKRVLSNVDREKLLKASEYFAWVPMEIVGKLPPKFGRTKFFLVLWMCSRINNKGWFKLKNTICGKYGISKRMKSRYVVEFERLGLIKVNRSTGQLSEIKLDL